MPAPASSPAPSGIVPDWTSPDGTVRLYCADCLDVLPTLTSVDAVVTDPPYGCGLNYGAAYDDSREDYWPWFRERLDVIRSCCPLVAFTHRNHAMKHLHDWDWVGVWNKPGSFGSRIGNSMILPHWEPIFFYGIHQRGTISDYLPDVLTFNPQPAKAGFNGIGREKWDQNGNGRHPCPKPLPLITRLVMGMTGPGETVLDPFMGSATTALACIATGRRFVGIEISPQFFELSVASIQRELAQPTFTFARPQPKPVTGDLFLPGAKQSAPPL